MSRCRRGAILASGRGSNMRALLAASQAPDHPIRFVLVGSDRAEAPALDAAREFGVHTVCIPVPASSGRLSFETRLDTVLRKHSVELICLAGFMRVLSRRFVARWSGRILNIHPSLLPRHPGLDTHARAIASGDHESGCTVQVVTDVLDGGPVLARSKVAVRPSDTPERLAARVLAAEHRLYPATAARYALRGLPAGTPVRGSRSADDIEGGKEEGDLD